MLLRDGLLGMDHVLRPQLDAAPGIRSAVGGGVDETFSGRSSTPPSKTSSAPGNPLPPRRTRGRRRRDDRTAAPGAAAIRGRRTGPTGRARRSEAANRRRRQPLHAGGLPRAAFPPEQTWLLRGPRRTAPFCGPASPFAASIPTTSKGRPGAVAERAHPPRPRRIPPNARWSRKTVGRTGGFPLPDEGLHAVEDPFEALSAPSASFPGSSDPPPPLWTSPSSACNAYFTAGGRNRTAEARRAPFRQNESTAFRSAGNAVPFPKKHRTPFAVPRRTAT